MDADQPLVEISQDPSLIVALARYAVVGCFISAIAVLIADFVVPNHDWIADTISDLGAGKYEFIVDIGIYAFSSSLVAIALLAAHIHAGGWQWSLALVGLALLSLIVFLIGARNEYGDNDDEGIVIHIYLVYAIGILMTAIPALMAKGIARFSPLHRRILYAISLIWTVSAPAFFFLPTEVDGIYERYLALIAFALVFALAHVFVRYGTALRHE